CPQSALWRGQGMCSLRQVALFTHTLRKQFQLRIDETAKSKRRIGQIFSGHFNGLMMRIASAGLDDLAKGAIERDGGPTALWEAFAKIRFELIDWFANRNLALVRKAYDISGREAMHFRKLYR